MNRRSAMQWGVMGIMVSACFGNGAAPGRQDNVMTTRPIVTVVNSNWADVKVSIVNGSVPYDLGRVSGYQTRVFEVPSALQNATVRFVIRQLGSRAEHVTQEIALDAPGQGFELRVGPRLSASELVIR
jgi:hypothetical protein